MDSVHFLNLEYIFLRIFDFVKNLDPVALLNQIIYYISFIDPLAVTLALFLFFVIFYSILKLRKLEKIEEEKFHAKRFKEALAEPDHDPVVNKKWQEVQAHINSTNPSDWRLAILEADIMLDTVLDKMGYQGDSIGDKLKGIDKSEFTTIDAAWEAHKVRNQIAHEGSDYLLNERDAKKTVDLYRRVFEEFFYI